MAKPRLIKKNPQPGITSSINMLGLPGSGTSADLSEFAKRMYEKPVPGMVFAAGAHVDPIDFSTLVDQLAEMHQDLTSNLIQRTMESVGDRVKEILKTIMPPHVELNEANLNYYRITMKRSQITGTEFFIIYHRDVRIEPTIVLDWGDLHPQPTDFACDMPWNLFPPRPPRIYTVDFNAPFNKRKDETI